MAIQNTLAAGTRLENYVVGQVLGVGGFGITYKGYDNSLDCDVAIKEYLPGDLAVRDKDGTTVQPKSESDLKLYRYGLNRFLDEARTLAKFRDPNIVRVTRYLECHGTAYIIMDYEDGQPLNRFLKKVPNLTEDDLLHIFIPILNGLRAVHARDFLHRDIKPGNIYLRNEGHPVLIDFGAARQALSGHNRDITSIVTPGYAPFEQYNTRDAQGPYTDLYAVGATIYHCITKKAPVPSIDRVAAVKSEDQDPLLGLGGKKYKQYSDAFLNAVNWMLALEARDRPQNVDAILEKLIEPDTTGAETAKTIISKLEIDTTVVLSNAHTTDWDPAFLSETEHDLAQYIGPLARVLVNQAAAETDDPSILVQRLSESIPTESQRSQFLKKSGQRTTSRSMKDVMSGRIPTSSRYRTRGLQGLEWSAERIQAIEKLLAQSIGPLARTIIKKQLTTAYNEEDLLRSIVAEIENVQDKETFLIKARRKLLKID